MSEDDPPDPDRSAAIARYQAISAYLALNPPWGARRELLEKLAKNTWTDEHGQPMQVEAETLRAWVRRYRRGGLAALQDKPRTRTGVQVLTPEQCELVCKLKEQVPERSLERIIRIAEETKLVEPGVLFRSTVHRVLQSRGLSARKARVPDAQDLDRFEAAFPNELWQSDMLQGPWLPDPERPGKVRRAMLYAFLDDHSRLLLHGRFHFREDLPLLELVFRRAIQRWGIPNRVYYDNGQVYRSGHMQQIVASLGMHRIVYTRVRRPEGHGKIEAFNRSVRSQFLSELKQSTIRTLDELNEAFMAWVELEYNATTHSETGQPPAQRWRAGVERVRWAEEEVLRQAFLWKEDRSPDKTGVFPLLGIRFQLAPSPGRGRIQVRFDPEDLHEVEVWFKGKFHQRARPLQIGPWRRPQAKPAEPAKKEPKTVQPTAGVDWLNHLVRKNRSSASAQPPAVRTPSAQQQRAQADQQVLQLLAERLDPAAFDEKATRELLARFGPFDPKDAARALEKLFQGGARNDQHVAFYIDVLRHDRTHNHE